MQAFFRSFLVEHFFCALLAISFLWGWDRGWVRYVSVQCILQLVSTPKQRSMMSQCFFIWMFVYILPKVQKIGGLICQLGIPTQHQIAEPSNYGLNPSQSQVGNPPDGWSPNDCLGPGARGDICHHADLWGECSSSVLLWNVVTHFPLFAVYYMILYV